MSSPQEFDCIVIGAGQGGALARMLAEAGQHVALIEENHLGGTCINYGCTPTKARISAAKIAADARAAHRFGVHVENIRVSLPEIVQRSDEIVASFRESTSKRLDSAENLEVICGHGSFTDSTQIEVRADDGQLQTLAGKSIVIATGTKARIPDLEGLKDVPFLDYKRILKLQEVPDHLIILGGGYIACEYGQMFARFGAKVTIIQSGPQLLEKEDEDVAAEMVTLLKLDGVEVHLNAAATSVEATESGIRVHLKDGPRLDGSHLFVAVGQEPRTEGLNLEKAGVRVCESGHIQADEFLQAAPHVFALGDVKGGPAFTHISFDDARILYSRLVEERKVSTEDRPLPYVVFTDPQLGRIGMSERDAGKAGLNYKVAKIAVTDTARGVETGQQCGFLKVLVEEKTNRILGGAFLTAEGGEIMATLQIAMQAGLPYTALRDAIFAHPTMSEALNNVFLAMDRAEKGRDKEDCIRTSVQ